MIDNIYLKKLAKYKNKMKYKYICIYTTRLENYVRPVLFLINRKAR